MEIWRKEEQEGQEKEGEMILRNRGTRGREGERMKGRKGGRTVGRKGKRIGSRVK